MNVEPSLESFMELNIKIAQTSFSEKADDAVLREFVLFTFARMGLAEKRGCGDDAVWVKTDLLQDLESETGPTEENNVWQMAEPIRLLLAAIVETTFVQLLRLKKEGSSVERLDGNATDSKRPLLTVIPGGKSRKGGG